MPSGKIGSLVYDVIADTRQFTKGLIPAKKELTAFNRMMINTRTPMEKLGIEFDGIARVARSGLAPIDALSRTVGQLAVETKGGGREAREFAQSLRKQAGAIGGANLGTQRLTEAEKNLQNHLRAVADASEQEVNSLRAKRAETLLAERAARQAAAAAAQQAEADKKIAAEAKKAAEALQKRKKAIAEAASAATKARQQSRQRSIDSAKGIASQSEAARLSRVRSEIEATVPAAKKLATRMAEVRQEFAAGNISQEAFERVQRKIAQELHETTAAYAKEQQQLQQNAQQLSRVKSLVQSLVPQQDRLQQTASELHSEYRKGNITSTEYQRAIKHLREEFNKTTDAYDKKQKQLQQNQEQLARVKSLVASLVPQQDRLQQTASELFTEYKNGNITLAEYRRAIKHVREETYKTTDAYEKDQKQLRENAQQLSRVKSLVQSLVPQQDRLQQTANELHSEYKKGNITSAEYQRAVKHLRGEYNKLDPAVQEADARLQRVRATVERTITPMQKLEKEQRELSQEFKRGTISAQEYRRSLAMLMRQKRELSPTWNKTTKNEKKLGAQFAAIAKHVAGITLAYKALDQVRQGLQDAFDMERATKQFEIFTGSVQQSTRIIAGLRDIVARTPLTFASAQQATRTMMQYGVASEDVLLRLRQIGDVSGGNHEALQRLALAMGQVTANGRLQGQELRQLIEAGFNPLQSIAEKTGKTMFELRVEMGEGKISAEDVAKSLDAATSAGGRFADVLERIGTETNVGKIERLRGQLQLLRQDYFENLTDGLGDIGGSVADDLTEQRAAAKKAVSDLRKGSGDGLKEFAMADLFSGGLKQMAGIIALTKELNTEEEIRFKLVKEISKEQAFADSEQGKALAERIGQLKKETDLRKRFLEFSSQFSDPTNELKSEFDREEELRNADAAGVPEKELEMLRKALNDSARLEGLEAMNEEMKKVFDLGQESITETRNKRTDKDQAKFDSDEFIDKHGFAGSEAQIKAAKDFDDRILRAWENWQEIEGLADDGFYSKFKEQNLQFAEQAFEELMDAQQHAIDVAGKNDIDKGKDALSTIAAEREKQLEDRKLSAKHKEAVAATRGSKAEFKLLSSMQTQRLNAERQRHKEAQDLRTKMNKALTDVGLNLADLPQAIQNMLPEAI